MSTRGTSTTCELKTGQSPDNAEAVPQKPGASARTCQVQSIPGICGPDGRREIVPLPLPTRLRLWLRKRLNGRFKRAIKKMITEHAARRRSVTGTTAATARPIDAARPPLKPGDTVRVRSRQQIEATLNPWGELKGCAFMGGMWQYCDTTQRVFKSVERFMDERNYQMRKARGIVLLENVICEGAESPGRCDRSCLYFWREEWIENIQDKQET